MTDNVEMHDVATRAGHATPVVASDAPRRDGERTRLLLAAPFAPRRDAKHGGRVIAQLLLRLVNRYSVALVHLHRRGADPVEPELLAACDVVEQVEVGGRAAASTWRRRSSVLLASVGGVPDQVAEIRSEKLERACLAVAARWQPDVVQVEHDGLAYLGAALARNGSPAARILTCHEPGGSAAMDQAAVARGRRRLAHRANASAWRRYWARMLPSFDAVVAFTDEDRRALEHAVRGPRYVTIPLGIDIPSEPSSPTGDAGAGVLFIGGYRHPPNSDAARRLLASIMPAVRDRVPSLPLMLVGAEPGDDLIAMAGPDDEVTGAVPSVQPYVERAQMLVLPIRLGGGMRVKLLEGLAAGKAVIATRLAAAGLDLTHGRQILFAESDEEFADAIVRLVTDEALRVQLGAAARRWAVAHLGWEPRVERYRALYESLTDVHPS
jgi:polysaccharide biosynthesis protein PslH